MTRMAKVTLFDARNPADTDVVIVPLAWAEDPDFDWSTLETVDMEHPLAFKVETWVR